MLDLMVPGRSGFQVLRDIRARKGDMPVLMLSARDSVEDRIAGLDAGADDYMIKPFALAEVAARLRALLRRRQSSQPRLHVADLEIDVIRHAVSRAGRRIDLRPKEYALLEFLIRKADARSRGRSSSGTSGTSISTASATLSTSTSMP